MANWLERLVAAYRPMCLRGLLLDGPYPLGAARVREPLACAHGTPVTHPAVGIDPMPVPATRLEPSP